MRRYVLVAKKPDDKQSATITDALKETGVGWWHWYRDAWLIADSRDNSLAWWREHICRVTNNGIHFYIFAATSDFTAWSSPEEFEWFKTSGWDGTGTLNR